MNGLTQYPEGTLYNAPQDGTTAQTITTETIQAWLISELSQQLDISPDEIDIQEPFDYYGLSSREAVSLSGDLQEWLGRDLSPTLVWEYPNIESLARYLAGEESDSELDGDVASFSGESRETKDQTSYEPIAIIGLGCRFPGGANDPQAFWQLLQNGQDAIREVPAERWALEDSANGDDARWGGFLEHTLADQFDAKFFSISPREAEQMDPQQRLLLEVSWEALEEAGVPPHKLAGSQTGVFIGISSHDYSDLQDLPTAYTGTGNAFSIAANRLSYMLDLRGPSWAVDTACSSSLVAVHQAIMSLRQGESSLALAGGVNLILSPFLTSVFSQAGMMAADGRCKTFDAKADGYVRGEGCGIVILKRLSDAQRDDDQILALIRGSAVNQDGRSNGLTAPNALAQQAVIRQALKNADVTASQLSYIEAHGTGTSLGDPIEVSSLKEVLTACPLGMEGRSHDSPCFVGSVKTNIGHLEAAAGIAGLIKVVLSLQHEVIPPHLHLKELNPHISLTDTPLSIPTESQPWPRRGGERRLAGVSSFGFGGTNAHLILEAPTGHDNAPVESERVEEAPTERPKHLFTLSAKSEKALFELASRYEIFLASHEGISLADLCFTANTGRTHFEHRLAVVAESTKQLGERLSYFVSNKEYAARGVIKGQVQHGQPKITFLFTGQGSQYVGMGQELYESEPIFRQTLERCDEILRPYLSQSLLSVLYTQSEFSFLDETDYTQPALFALEYALAQVWRAWGIEADYLCGHSVGEYVAACVAGVFSLEDGLKLIAERGRLMAALPHCGEMVSLLADEARVRTAIAPYTHDVSIAAVNGAESVVISGQQEAVRAIAEELAADGVKTRRLTVSHAFHSPLMEPMLEKFRQVAERITYHQPKLPLISNLTGQLVGDDITTPDYWVRHIRQAVRFADSITTLQQEEVGILLEIGPKPILLAMAAQAQPRDACVAKWQVAKLPSLRATRGSEWQQMLESLAELYVRGVQIEWSGHYAVGTAHRRMRLPTYPWQRKRYWLAEKKEAKNVRKKPQVRKVEHKNRLWEEWFYEIAWQPQELASEEKREEVQSKGSWLILADKNGLGDALEAALQERGQSCIKVLDEAARANDFEHFLQTLRTPCLGIIYLWGLDILPPSTLTDVTLQEAERLGAVELMYLVQSLARLGWRDKPRLWVVTEGAQLVTSAEKSLAVAQAPLWGLGRVLAHEHPALKCSLVDLQPTRTNLSSLVAELLANSAENQIAFRDSARYVARLTRQKSSEGASPSLDFIAAYYALQELARLRSGERILIHSAAEGTGLAAVKIAQLIGAEIFATAENEEKCDKLRALGIQHLYDSDSPAFVDEIMANTNGQGVDVMFNWPGSSASPAMTAELELLAPFGRFLDIGPCDTNEDSQNAFWPFKKNLAYFTIDLDQMSSQRPELFASLLEEVAEFMPALPEAPLFQPNATYLITGGLGGLGLTIARYLIEQGARHLVLMSRRPPSEAVRAEINQMEQSQEGTRAQVTVMQADVTKLEQLKGILDQIEQTKPPLRGLIHAAGVLDDGILLQLNAERFRKVMAPKVNGAWNLHLLTADKPLDFFVLFSSVASLLGSPGQANYSAANAFLDALAHYRRAQGQVGLSINWGPWSEVGLAADKRAHHAGMARQRTQRAGSVGGIRAMSAEQGVAIFAHLLRQNQAQVGVMPLNLRHWQQLYPAISRSPLFSNLLTQEDRSRSRVARQIWHDKLKAVDSLSERRHIVESHLHVVITLVLHLQPDEINSHSSLGGLGFDSLMALELRNRLEDDLGLSLPATLIWNYQTIADLASHLIEKMGFASAKPSVSEVESASAVTALLSEEESEAFAELLHELDGISLDELQEALA